MNYYVKMFLRKVVHKYPMFNNSYKVASKIKDTLNIGLSDEEFFKRRYKENTGKILNLKFPKTFNEKLLWLQIHDHNPLYTLLSDKLEVKNYVREMIGAEYVVPLINVWNSADDIRFENLPDEYVLKCTHDSGTIIVKRKEVNINVRKVRARLRHALRRNYYNVGRVWAYKDIKPRIICEDLIKTKNGQLPRDYKIFCFNGEPRFCFVASDRETAPKFDFFDISWKKIPVMQHYPNSNYNIKKPERWEEILNFARRLSSGIPQVRVDFYIGENDSIFFGEMTFCHFSGKENFVPDEYDEIFGGYITVI